MDHKHSRLVAKIAAEVKAFYDRKKPFYVFHGSTNSTRILSFKRSEMVDVSQLDHVLGVDVKRRVALTEPNVTMDKLVRRTLKHGLVPPVVMEFPGITVGGGIQGGAGESSSFRWGCFNQTFNWYEMVLANGQVVKASPSQNAGLFHGTAGSYGSLGLITAGEIQLVPAHKYVRLTYLPVNSFEAAGKMTKQNVTKRYDFIDGIIFGPDRGVIIVGTLSNKVKGRLQRFSRAHDPWFYLHANKIANRQERFTETVPLVDYLFRYDRGTFWVGHNAFELFGVRFNAFTRWLLNPILHTRKLYQALQASGGSQRYIIQDLALPYAQAVKFMKFTDKSLGIYPLWICPLKPDSNSPLQSNNLETPLVINIGVWGSYYDSYDKFVADNRLIEAKIRELGGKKWFYAHSFYTEKEFWSIYDKQWYKKLRSEYNATTLPDIFEKIRVKDRYDVNVKRGLYKTLLGRAKLRVKT